jgi:hypothetical protein
MSVVLFIIGVITALLGAGMIAYGIPVKEFSFGNTLIMAGTTSAVGGLVIVAIGVAIGHLQQIAETLAARAEVGSSQPRDMVEPPAEASAAPGHIPFPPPPKPERAAHRPMPPMEEPAEPAAHAEIPVSDDAAASAAPGLQNPEAAAAVTEELEVQEYEDVSLSPQPPSPAPLPDFEPPKAPPRTERSSPAFEPPPRFAPPPPQRPSQPSYFDAMWPPESKPARRPVTEPIKPEPQPDPAHVAVPDAQNPEPPPAILKSGVVDGMAYTLYVDGSIEAELPSGVLHFASINELRDHLAKNS